MQYSIFHGTISRAIKMNIETKEQLDQLERLVSTLANDILLVRQREITVNELTRTTTDTIRQLYEFEDWVSQRFIDDLFANM